MALFRIMIPEKDFGRTLARLRIKELSQDGKYVHSKVYSEVSITCYHNLFIALGFKSISRAVFGEEVKYHLSKFKLNTVDNFLFHTEISRK